MYNVILAENLRLTLLLFQQVRFISSPEFLIFIDAKEKVQEYVPDYLISEMDLVNGTAWDLLELIQSQALPSRFILIHDDLTYAAVRKAFRKGVWDYLPAWNPQLLELSTTPIPNQESDPQFRASAIVRFN